MVHHFKKIIQFLAYIISQLPLISNKESLKKSDKKKRFYSF